MDTDPISIDLNVDAALVLRDLVGIDTYPAVLAILPNIFRIEDRERVRTVVTGQLREAGIVEGDTVHPAVAGWLRSLERPDVELAARIIDNGRGGHTQTMLRISLVRAGESHVLAVRCDDQVVIQQVFHEGRHLNTLTAALKSALGDYPALEFEAVTVATADLSEIPADPDECRTALRELGAAPHTASVLTRALGEIVRRAEVIMIEHRDGGSGLPEKDACTSVVDTLSGRFIVTPAAALDGQLRSTFRPGDDSSLRSGINALVELLPSRSWFDTVRTG
ncbi:ESX secretion-associated protein EspG [Nocardia sp. CA-290969]|uniref:ESX secretion-associated protein EspG n=1 Tax=Nocardia sp. CA-290969 TaxID=3239986 RepID=UPI003D8D6FB7